jgi:hypothetical protein
MAQHVRMDGKGHLGGLAKPGNEMVEAECAHRPATLGNEDVGFCGVLAPELAQSTDFIASDRMDTWYAAFSAANVQPALVKFDLMPLQIAHFRSSQAMTIGDQDHGCIAMATSVDLASRVHEALDLALGEIAAGNCEGFGGWYCAFG